MKPTSFASVVLCFVLVGVATPVPAEGVGSGSTCAGDVCPPPFTIGDLPFQDDGDTCALTSSVDVYSPACSIGGDDYSGRDAVYEIELTEGNRDVEFFLPHLTGDFVLAVLRDCGEGARCVVSSPDLDGVRQERIPPASYPPGTYYVYVDAAADADPACGRFELQVRGVNPPEPDLALEVTGPVGPAVAGAGLTFSLAVVNDSPFSASDATVRAVLPAGVTFLSASPGCVRDTPRQVVCAVGEVPRDTTQTREVTVRTNPAQRAPVTVTASLEGVEPDPDPTDNQASTTAQVVARADLRLAWAAPPAAVAGRSVPYTLTVTNDGPSTATGVRAAVSVPEGAVLESVPVGCLASGERRFTCANFGVLGPGQTVQLAFTARVDPAFRGGLLSTATVSNRAVAGAGEADPDPASNRAQARTEVVEEVTLTLSKTAVPGTVEVAEGGTSLVLYQLSVTNDGPSDALGVVVTDAFDGFPEGVTFRSSVGCENDPQGFPECELGSVPAGATAEYVLTFALGDGETGAVTNTASTGAAEDSATVTLVSVAPPPELNVMVEVIEPPFFTAVVDEGSLPSIAREYSMTVPVSAGIVELLVGLRISRSLEFLDSTFCALDPVGFPRCRLADLDNDGSFFALWNLATVAESSDPAVVEFAVTAVDAQGNEMADALVRCLGVECAEVDEPPATVAQGASLAVPRFDVDPARGATTLYSVRNAGDGPVVVRFEYLDDEGESRLRLAEIRPLLPRQQRTVNLRDVVDGPVTGSVRISAVDPETGRVLAEHPLTGDVLQVASGAASGDSLPDLARSPAADCTRWNVGFSHDDLFSAGTSFPFLVPGNPGSNLQGVIHDADGATRGILLDTSLDSFERRAATTQGLLGVAGSIEWTLERPGFVAAVHRGDGVAAGAPGTCLSPSTASGRLLVPYFELDRSADKTTRFSMRNTDAEPIEVQIRYVEASGQTLGEDVLVLAGHTLRQLDLRDVSTLANEQNLVTGFIEIDASAGSLTGEYQLVDLVAGVVGGGALVDRDRSREPSGLCRRWDQRFVQGDGVETRILIYMEDAFDQSFPFQEAFLVGELFDENGQPVPDDTQEMTGNRVFVFVPPTGAGTVEFRFRNDRIGHVVGLVTSGNDSVLIPAVCRDLGPLD